VLRVGVGAVGVAALNELASAAADALVTQQPCVRVSAAFDSRDGCASTEQAHGAVGGPAAPEAQAWPCGLTAALPENLSDAQLDTWLARWLSGDGATGSYSLLLLPPSSSQLAAAPRLVFGSRRVAWVRGLPPADEQAAVVAAARRWSGDGAGSSPSSPPLSPGALLRLDLALCNVEPDEGYAFTWRWEGLGGLAALWQPVVEILAPLCTLAVGSAVRPHGCGMGAELGGTESRLVPSAAVNGLVVPPLVQPQLVEAVRRGAELAAAAPGGAPTERRLHLLALVPPARLCPLRLSAGSSDAAPVDGLTSPGWGGVVVWNPPGCGSNGTAAVEGGAAAALSFADLRALSALWLAQLRRLLGLHPLPRHDELAHPSGFAAWEVDLLQRRSAQASLAASAAALAALEHAVARQSVPVTPSLALLASRALSAHGEALSESGRGLHNSAAGRAAAAHAAAEEASSHPSLLARLYFPGEHKLAVYLPLLLPSLLPLVLAVLREHRHLRKRRAYASAHRHEAGA